MYARTPTSTVADPTPPTADLEAICKLLGITLPTPSTTLPTPNPSLTQPTATLKTVIPPGPSGLSSTEKGGDPAVYLLQKVKEMLAGTPAPLPEPTPTVTSQTLAHNAALSTARTQAAEAQAQLKVQTAILNQLSEETTDIRERFNAYVQQTVVQPRRTAEILETDEIDPNATNKKTAKRTVGRPPHPPVTRLARLRHPRSPSPLLPLHLYLLRT